VFAAKFRNWRTGRTATRLSPIKCACLQRARGDFVQPRNGRDCASTRGCQSPRRAQTPVRPAAPCRTREMPGRVSPLTHMARVVRRQAPDAVRPLIPNSCGSSSEPVLSHQHIAPGLGPRWESKKATRCRTSLGRGRRYAPQVGRPEGRSPAA